MYESVGNFKAIVCFAVYFNTNFHLIKSTNFVLLYRMISALVQKKYEVHLSFCRCK